MSWALPTWRVGRWGCCVGLLASAALLAGCGGDGGPSGGSAVVRIAIVGAPTVPMSPGQSAQLTANAVFSDGTGQDVTAVARWDTTDQSVLAVSAAGSLNAAGPGRADVSATLGGTRDSVSVVVVALPAAYFLNDVEYAFDYQLDAKGRVASYRITRKPEIDYGSGLGQSSVFAECQGDLYATYECRWLEFSVMRGELGRLVSVRRGPYPASGTVTYRYGPQGLSGIEASWQGLTSHEGGSTTTGLAHDHQGRLATVDRDDRCYSLGGASGTRSTVRITVDAQGRLAHGEYAAQAFGPESCTNSGYGLVPTGILGPTEWLYDAQGFMTSAGATRYVADADGWLSRRSEGVGASVIIDTYAIVRVGTQLAEESFTQAEPRAFYVSRGRQRVRYEWGRLPSEPLFVPRALAGLNGADYFGILSSHHR